MSRVPVVASVVASLWLCSASAAAQTLEARLTFAQNEVEVGSSQRHPAQLGETLSRGTRVITRTGAAEIQLANQSRLRTGESTTLVMFAPATPPPAGTTPTDDTTLVRGRVLVTSSENEGQSASVVLATPGSVVTVQGMAHVHVDSGRATRVAVYRGRARVRAGGRELVVRAGQGVRVDPGRPPTPPRALPVAPVWTNPPVTRVSTGAPVDLRGTFAAGVGTTPVQQWRLQLARDERFNDLVFERTAAVRATQFEAPQLVPGTYYARVSGIDQERFEGVPSTVASFVVAAPRVVPGGQGRRATVEIPPGFYCGLNGAALSPARAPLPLAPARHHVLRCASGPDGADAIQIPISSEQAGPLVRQIRLEPSGFDVSGGMRVVVLQLSDGAGAPVSYANLTTTVTPGASLENFRETDRRGTYTATLHWRRGVPGVRLRIRVNDAEEFDHVLGQPPGEVAP